MDFRLHQERSMLPTVHLRSILNDEALTRGLGDPEARLLVEWLVDEAEELARHWPQEEDLSRALTKLRRRARGVSRFVRLWCYDQARGAACQLAAAEGFTWPLPTTALDPCELMYHILCCEGHEVS
jgi:hypothetical protein